jgi:dienelactone hydrolase
MNIILVSDIFGKTDALEKLSEKLNAKTIVDPYNNEYINFADENEAYEYFIKNVGLDNYLKKVKSIVEMAPNNSILIGFSIGASVIWRLSEVILSKQIKSAVCFYGSQIRNFTDISPCFKIELIFPKKEEHFDVEKLETILSKKNNVESKIVKYLHGFMNYYSKNYNQDAYLEYLNLLRMRYVKQ